MPGGSSQELGGWGRSHRKTGLRIRHWADAENQAIGPKEAGPPARSSLFRRIPHPGLEMTGKLLRLPLSPILTGAFVPSSAVERVIGHRPRQGPVETLAGLSTLVTYGTGRENKKKVSRSGAPRRGAGDRSYGRSKTRRSSRHDHIAPRPREPAKL